MAKLLGGYTPDDQKPASKRAKVDHGIPEENIPLPSSSKGVEALAPMHIDGAEVPEKKLPGSSKGAEALAPLQCDGAVVPEKTLPGSSKGVKALAPLQYDGPEVQEKMLPLAEVANKINSEVSKVKQTEEQVVHMLKKPHNSDMSSSATQGTNTGSFSFQNCTVSVVFQN
jgi:hypothetical protein